MQKAKTRNQKDIEHSSASRRRLPVASGLRPVAFCLLLCAFCLLFSACRRDMQDQPKAIPYRQSSFFKDGSASRPLVEGTVSRGNLRADRAYYFGKKPASTAASPPAGAPANPAAMFPDDVETLPIPVNKKVLDDGQERYDIFCSSCHGLTGNGDGMIARRGFSKPAPASLHQEKLQQAPVGHFFDVITNGWGAMPSHASQIPVEDRWKIIAYIRALQLSQRPPDSKPAAVAAPEGQKKQ